MCHLVQIVMEVVHILKMPSSHMILFTTMLYKEHVLQDPLAEVR